MRIDALHLIRYGHFQDARLEFPIASCDLHLIVGENEAGKTTLRKAVLDWLFGIPMQSAMNVGGYEKSQLSIAGRLSAADGKALEFTRRKAAKVADSLRDPAGNPIPLAALDPFLSAALKRDVFERMFCMGTVELRRGVETLIDSSSDDPFARVLWQSTSGIPGLQTLEQALIAEAEALYEPGGRKKGGRRFDDAAKRVDEQRALIKELTVSASTYDTARKLRDSTQQSLEEVQKQQLSLRTRQAQLQRVRATAADFDAYHRVRADLESRAPVPAVAADAELRASGVVTAVTKLRGDIQRETDTRDREGGLAQALVLPQNLKSMIDSVGRIAHDQKTAEDSLKDEPGVAATHRRNLEQALTKAKQTGGFSGATVDELRAWLPGAAHRKAASEILVHLERAITGNDEAHAKAENRQRDLQRLRDQVVALAPPADMSALGEAHARLVAAPLDVQGQKDLDRLQERFDRALKLTGPAGVSLEQLEALDLPTLGQARQYEADRTRLDNAADGADAALTALKDDEARANDRLSKAQSKARVAIDAEALQQSRTQRDALWAGIRLDPQQLPTLADAYESNVRGADAVADARFDHHETAHEVEAARRECESLTHRIQDAQARAEQARSQAAAHRQQWSDRLLALGLKPMGEADLQRLGSEIAQLRAQADAMIEKRIGLNASRSRHEAARGALAVLLSASVEVSVETLLSKAQTQITEANSTNAQRKLLADQVKSHEADVDTLTQAAKRSEADLMKLRQRAQGLCTAAGLAADVDPTLGRELLVAMGEIEITLAGLGETGVRIDQMRSAISGFRDLVARTLVDFGMTSSGDVLTDARDLRAAAADLERKDKDRKDHEKAASAADAKVQRATAEIETAMASIAGLMTQTGATTLEGLMAVVGEADQQRELKERGDELRRKMVSAAGGVTFEELGLEIGQCDRATLAVDLAQIDEQLNGMNAAIISAAQQAQEAARELAKMGDGDAIVHAEAARQMALSDMREAVDRFVTVRGSAEILRWALRRYRQQAQGPMLATASQMFRTMTSGRYAGLTIDLDAETPRLLAVLANSGRHVGIDDLSEGTRQPLYLALRLASIDLYLKDRPGMVFIADDLFVDMDDERAAAGFAVLGQIATRGQVFYLTHHHHLDPIARTAVPSAQVTTIKRPADLVPAG